MNTSAALLHPDPYIAANRALWLAELRKPESRPHIGALESADYPHSRCCLGHACAALEIIRYVEKITKFSHSRRVVYAGECGYLAPAVAERLDITRRGGLIRERQIGRVRYVTLANINDKVGWPPARMADFIEEQMRSGNLKPYAGR